MAETKTKTEMTGEIPPPDFPPAESEYQLVNLKSQGIKLCGDCGGRLQYNDEERASFCPQRTKENQKYCPMLKVV